jgi:sugar phosphate isomerase/epimerase
MAYPAVSSGHGPILETLKKIVEDEYFTAVEVTWIHDSQTRAEAAKMLGYAHMDVIFAGQPPLLSQKLDLNSADETSRNAAIEQCKRSIDQAYELGASIVAVLSGPDPGDAERKAAIDRLVDSLIQICNYAKSQSKDKPITVSLETFDRDIEKKCLVGPTDIAIEVAEKVTSDCSNFGLTIDLSHQPLLGETINYMVIKASPYLVHTHIGNCVIKDTNHPAYGDQHPIFGCPSGEIDVEEVAEFIRCLYDVGFFKKEVPTKMPVVSFEVKPLPDQDPDIIVAAAKRVLNEAWAKI